MPDNAASISAASISAASINAVGHLPVLTVVLGFALAAIGAYVYNNKLLSKNAEQFRLENQGAQFAALIRIVEGIVSQIPEAAAAQREDMMENTRAIHAQTDLIGKLIQLVSDNNARCSQCPGKIRNGDYHDDKS